MKVMHKSNKYVTLTIGSFIGQAQSADLVPDTMIDCDINRCTKGKQSKMSIRLKNYQNI